MEKKKSLLKLILISFLLTACAFGGRSPDPHYYLMGYNLEPALQQDNPLVLGLGPITIADYLTRPQIVTRSSGNQVSYNDLHRWASGLRENIMDVLASSSRCVTKVEVLADFDKLDIYTPVYVVIFPDKIRMLDPKSVEKNYAQPLIDKGLRASLEMQSLVTGKLMVALSFKPATEPSKNST